MKTAKELIDHAIGSVEVAKDFVSSEMFRQSVDTTDEQAEAAQFAIDCLVTAIEKLRKVRSIENRKTRKN